MLQRRTLVARRILRVLAPLTVSRIVLVMYREGTSVDTVTIHPVLWGYKLQAIDVCTLRSLYLRLTYQHASGQCRRPL